MRTLATREVDRELAYEVIGLGTLTFRFFGTDRLAARFLLRLRPTHTYSRAYVIAEYFIPELAKITGRDLVFHFDDLIHLKLVLGWRSRYDR